MWSFLSWVENELGKREVVLSWGALWVQFGVFLGVCAPKHLSLWCHPGGMAQASGSADFWGTAEMAFLG